MVDAGAHGTVRWLTEEETGGPLGIRITVQLSNGKTLSRDYEVEKVAGGYRLHYVDGTKCELITYHIRYGLRSTGTNSYPDWSCTCEDSKYRPEKRGECKHVRSLRAALNAIPF